MVAVSDDIKCFKVKLAPIGWFKSTSWNSINSGSLSSLITFFLKVPLFKLMVDDGVILFKSVLCSVALEESSNVLSEISSSSSSTGITTASTITGSSSSGNCCSSTSGSTWLSKTGVNIVCFVFFNFSKLAPQDLKLVDAGVKFVNCWVEVK